MKTVSERGSTAGGVLLFVVTPAAASRVLTPALLYL